MSRALQPKRCYICNKRPELYARYENDKVRYVWYQCDGTYPCLIGPCIYPRKIKKKDLRKKATLGWNEWLKLDKEKDRRAWEEEKRRG